MKTVGERFPHQKEAEAQVQTLSGEQRLRTMVWLVSQVCTYGFLFTLAYSEVPGLVCTQVLLPSIVSFYPLNHPGSGYKHPHFTDEVTKTQGA